LISGDGGTFHEPLNFLSSAPNDSGYREGWIELENEHGPYRCRSPKIPDHTVSRCPSRYHEASYRQTDQQRYDDISQRRPDDMVIQLHCGFCEVVHSRHKIYVLKTSVASYGYYTRENRIKLRDVYLLSHCAYHMNSLASLADRNYLFNGWFRYDQWSYILYRSCSDWHQRPHQRRDFYNRL
jgi:hypothetical protein